METSLEYVWNCFQLSWAGTGCPCPLSFNYTPDPIWLAISFLLDLIALLDQYRTFRRNLVAGCVLTKNDLPDAVRDDRIYITAQFWTSAQVLRNGLSDTLCELVQILGTDNVFVSIVESGSLDNTKELLQMLDNRLRELNVERRILMSNRSHVDELNRQNEPGVLHFPEYEGNRDNNAKRREWETRRIPFLARERNRGLEPLREMGRRGKRFKKILVLNDVVVQLEDILTLLGTRQGRYSAACALDFHDANEGYYDTFALRDSEGDEGVQKTFPYFGSVESRRAIQQGMPTRVKSCWNGMVVMDARPFYHDKGDGETGLRYRGITDSLAEKHIEGSECCLIWADMEASGDNEPGLWVNPSVRVGYVKKAYEDTHVGPNRDFISGAGYVRGVWKNRIVRQLGSGMKKYRIRNRLGQWIKEGQQKGEKRGEVGEMCLVDETQVLVRNGWKHL